MNLCEAVSLLVKVADHYPEAYIRMKEWCNGTGIMTDGLQLYNMDDPDCGEYKPRDMNELLSNSWQLHLSNPYNEVNHE